MTGYRKEERPDVNLCSPLLTGSGPKGAISPVSKQKRPVAMYVPPPDNGKGVETIKPRYKGRSNVFFGFFRMQANLDLL